MKSALPVVAGVLMGFLFLLSFGIDWDDVSAGGTIDFRNRITGARLLDSHRDPYHYKWTKGEPPELCDPYNNLALPINRVTVTPTLLALNLPLAGISYQYSRFVWLTIQWMLLLGTGVIWFLGMPSAHLRWLWAAAVVGFTFTVAWRHHTDRGQAYVVMLFLLSAWIQLTRHEKFGNAFWPGLLAGLLIALRPPLLLLLAPFVLMRRRGQFMGTIAGLALSAGLPLLWSSSCWSEYSSAMQTWSELYRANTFNPRPPAQAYPAVIEGVPLDVLGHFGVIPFADSSLYALFRSFGIEPVPALPVSLSLVILIALWFWFSRSRSDETLFIGIAALAFLGDLFLPAPRNSYNDVQILSVFALALLFCQQRNWIIGLLLAAWPLNWAVMAALPREKWIINLPSVVMMAACVALLLWPLLTKSNLEPAAPK